MIKDKINFGIDRKEISHFTSIELSQTINNHHYFKITVPHSVIENPRSYTIENAQNSYSYLGNVLDDSSKLIANGFADEIQGVFNDLNGLVLEMTKIRTKYFVK